MCINFKRFATGASLFACLPLVLAGCGDFAGKGVATGSGTISGSAIAGPIKGATVQVYKLVKGPDGKLVQGDPVGPAGITNPDGSYTLSDIPETGGPVVVVVTGKPGASYTDESGITVPFSSNDRMSTAVTEVSNGQTVQITPVTDYAVQYIKDNATNLGADVKQAVQLGNLKVGEKFGLNNIVGLAPAIVKGEFNNVEQSTPEQKNYGLVLAGLAKLTQDAKIQDPTATVTIASVVNQVMGAKNVAGDTSLLTGAIAAYIKSDANDTGIVAVPPVLVSAIANADAVKLPTPAQLADTTAPSAPGGLVAAVAAGRIELSWNAATDNQGVAGYFVYRDGNSLGKALSPKFIDTLVSPSTTHVYRIEAFDAAGNVSARESIVNVTTPAPLGTVVLPPTSPSALAVFTLDSNKVGFSWKSSSDAVAVSGYDIFRNDIYLATVTAATTSYADTSVSGFTSYRYRVEAFNQAGKRAPSAELALVTPRDAAIPAATVLQPLGLSVAGVSSGSVSLTWSARSGVAGYKVYRDGGQEIAVLNAVSQPAFKDFSVLPKTSYSYFVKAFDALGNLSDAGATVIALTPADPLLSTITKPAAPTNLAAAGVTSSTVALSWTASTGATGYQIYRGGERIGSATQPGFSDAGVAASQSYIYTVTAFNLAGNESVVGTPLSVTTPAAPVSGDVTAPTVPGVPTAPEGSIGSTLVSFTWSAATDNIAVAGYEIIRNDQVIAGNVSQTSFSDGNVLPNTTYVYRVRAFDASGNRSAISAALSVTTLAPPVAGDSTAPTVPNGLNYASAPSSVVLSWNPSSDSVGVTGYEVFRSGVLIATVAQPGYLDVAVAPGNTYNYHLIAVDASGNRSAASSVVAAVTPAAPASGDLTAPSLPGNFAAVLGSSPVKVTLSWTAATDNAEVTGYEIYRNGVRIATVQTPGYTDLAVAYGTNYNYFVTAYDAAGNRSIPSNTILVPTLVVPADTEVPSTPTNLAPTAIAAGAVALAWTPSTDDVGVTGYRIYRDSVLIATSTQALYTDSMTLMPTTAYSYAVQAIDASGKVSAQSSPLSVSTSDLTVTVTGTLDPAIAGLPARDIIAPTAPAGLSALAFATTASSSSVVLSWSASTDSVGVAGYDVYRGEVKIASVASPGYTDPAVDSGTSISYRLIAFDAAGNRSPLSSALVVTPNQASLGVTVSGQLDSALLDLPVIDLFNPTAPAGLSAISFANSATTSSVALSWSASTDNVGIAGYEVWRSGVKIATISAPGYTDTTAASGTTYNYYVIGFDHSGNRSIAGNQLSVTPNKASLGVTVSGQLSDGILGLPGQDIVPPSTPASLVATTYANNATTSAVLLSWSPSTDNVAVVGYEVYRAGNKIATVNEPVYLDPSVASGNSFNYQVFAFDAKGNRSVAGLLNVTPNKASLGVTVSGLVLP